MFEFTFGFGPLQVRLAIGAPDAGEDRETTLTSDLERAPVGFWPDAEARSPR